MSEAPEQLSEQHDCVAVNAKDDFVLWSPDILERIASFLPANEVACTLRIVNKATMGLFRHRTLIRLSLPTPQHVFRQRWGSPGAARSQTHDQRLQLLNLTAASGVLDNLKTAMETAGFSAAILFSLLPSAAAAGHLHVCQWLLRQGCPWGEALTSAAESGHQQLCEWLLANGCPWDARAVYAAVRRGDVGLMEWLVRRGRRADVKAGDLIEAAAEGCDLAALQALHQRALAGQLNGPRVNAVHWESVVQAAARSPTADWRDKVEWLEQWVRPATSFAGNSAARCPDAPLERLTWLRQRGYRWGAECASYAACRTDLAVLRYLLDEGQLGWGPQMGALVSHAAAQAGRVDAMRLLAERGWPLDLRLMLKAAALGGHLAAVAWVAGLLGSPSGAAYNLLHSCAARLDESVFAEAASSGCLELMVWLREHGCGWDERAVVGAAGGGCVAALEWLVRQGCPMPEDGSPYGRAAGYGDCEVLRCLHRLGCPVQGDGGPYEAAGNRDDLATLRCLREELNYPFSPTADTFNKWVRRGGRLGSLQWLTDEVGCPVDWGAALSEARSSVWLMGQRNREVVAWLSERAAGGDVQGPGVADGAA